MLAYPKYQMLANNSKSKSTKVKGALIEPISGIEVIAKRESITRVDRKSQHGIDCADSVHFSHWYFWI